MRNKRLIILFSVLLSITLLVVFNSVLFSVQHVYASCLNVENSVYESKVLSSHKIKNGSSIFFVDKAKVTKNVEQATGYRVKVLNVEKSFPNRIYINYVEVKAYAHVKSGNTEYYIGNNMTVMDTAEGETTVELILGNDDCKFENGETFVYTSPSGINAAEALSQIINGYESCGPEYTHNQFVGLIKCIDLSGKFIRIQTIDGIAIEIINAQSLAKKVRFAVSVLKNSDDILKTEGTLIITGEQTASYRKPDGSVNEV